MPETRRSFIKKSVSLGACTAASASVLLPAEANAAWPYGEFATPQLEQAIARLFGGRDIKDSDQIKLKLPQIAENGAVVPIRISISLENVESIYIFVEKNYVPFAARFTLSPEVEPSVSARIKMAETCDVIVIAEADGKVFSAKQMVKVTIGGCGG